MRGKRIHIGAGALIAGLSFLLIGCTTEWTADTIQSCQALHTGDLVRLTDRDDNVHSGLFCNMKRMEFLEYVEHSKKMAMSSDKASRVPVPGERIMFTTVLEPDHVWNGVMIGFCAEYLWVKLQGDKEVSNFYVNGITRIVGVDGRIILRDELRTMISANEVPLMSLVTIKNDVDTLRFAVNNIKRIEVITPHALANDVNSLSGL
jgi:hypothetical protein